ncbi:MAG: Coenzyme F420 hydrogenase/dehydrogenase, beta subunit C-terminal domain, partial [Candidatus Cryptobacteroides sp.]
MIHITDKTLCCGCSACALKCPRRCITMQADSEGFLYPVVNEADCIDCGLCEKVCHELHPYDERKPLNVYAAINKDEEVRMNSSSGGIFYLLAEKTIAEGGVVFGARFDKEWQVMLDYAETMESVKPFMGSKYVQARTASAYKDAETFLKQGRKVLFSGSPCQIAGLHHYLRKEYENLTTVDFVCHGVPSPKVWQRYLDEVVKAGKKAISDVKFRNKGNGWNKFNFVLSYNKEDKTVSLSSWHQQNHYMRAFLSDMILRPSCHDCRAKQGRSHSDITIADFWGINREMPEMDDDKGTGLVLVNTEKGRQALDWNQVAFKESSLEVASKYNAGLSSQTKPHPKRTAFFAHLDTSDSVIDLIDKSLRPTFKRRIRLALRRYKQMAKEMLKIGIGGGKEMLLNINQHEILPMLSDNATVS